MSDPVFTIGMATFREPQLWATLQAIHACHPRCRYLVVDNAPEPDGKGANTVRAMGGDYVHRPDLWGTSAPRDAVMRLTSVHLPAVDPEDDHRMVIDAHVIPETGAIQAWMDYVRAHPRTNEMIVGPMIGDDGTSMFTHWRPEESAKPGLWGVWDCAWQAPDGTVFCVWGGPNNTATFRDVEGNEIPPIQGVNPHDPAASGCVKGGHTPYPIHSQGLGLFAMRRSAWVGFHPLNRGFGGEEGIAHEMVRRQGGRVMLLPQLRWRHCFRYHGGGVAHQEPTPYRLKIYDHTWNLLIGHRALGIDCTKQIYEHFGKNIPPVENLPADEKQYSWDALVKDSEKAQPFGTGWARKRRLNLLGVWYTNNAAPMKLMKASLASIRTAQLQTMHHNITIHTSCWHAIDGDPFSGIHGIPEAPPGHARIIAQIKRVIEQTKLLGAEWDGICFLEHDVLYPPGYFDRMGDGLLIGAPVVSNLDYIGINATGYLAVKERHEPMYATAHRRDYALANLDRAEQDCKRLGWCLIEPDSIKIDDQGKPVGEMPDRSHWLRLPPVGLTPICHVNWV